MCNASSHALTARHESWPFAFSRASFLFFSSSFSLCCSVSPSTNLPHHCQPGKGKQCESVQLHVSEASFKKRPMGLHEGRSEAWFNVAFFEQRRGAELLGFATELATVCLGVGSFWKTRRWQMRARVQHYKPPKNQEMSSLRKSASIFSFCSPLAALTSLSSQEHLRLQRSCVTLSGTSAVHMHMLPTPDVTYTVIIRPSAARPAQNV